MGLQYFWAAGCMSFASTVFLAAYGYHNTTLTKESRKQWEKAIRYQLFGSIPLLCSRFLPGTLLACSLSSVGLLLFCVPLYYTAASGDARFNRAMPLGGTLMALGWVALAFL